MSASVVAAAGITGTREREEQKENARSARARTLEIPTSDVHHHNVKTAVLPLDGYSQRRIGTWNPENFAAEQIRGLVRQIFFSHIARPVRQVLFSAVEADTDIRAVCRRVGEALTLETAERIAVVGAYPKIVADADDPQPSTEIDKGKSSLRQSAARLRGNLWLVPSEVSTRLGTSTASLHSLLCDLRREFEFSIVEAPPACESNSAAAMAELSDGIVLVLSANRTRRHAARKTKEILEAARARILGVVLTDRAFPIPEKIYRWL
jgi:hypothetical protein